MSPLVWATLLLSACGINANTGRSNHEENPCTPNAFSINFPHKEIKAEAGLCAVIPCTFTTCSSFTFRNYVWFKCESKAVCDPSDVILNTSFSSKDVQPNFRGKVSLLQPDANQKNCSIIINDLNSSDSGLYQFRVEGSSLKKTPDGFTFSSKIKVSVTDLTQRPTVTVPPLTEGLQTTLSCTAPGLCSGSAPEITWMWRRGGGEDDSHTTGNITDFKTETLTDVAQRHISTLNFTPSAKHHGTNITCKVSFTGGTTTEETVTLNVTYLKTPVIAGNTKVKDGDALKLTCSVDSFPPSVISWTKLSTNKSLNNHTGTAELIIPNMTTEDAGKYTCSATNQNRTESTQTHVGLSPKILNGSVCVIKSEVLTCVCISEGFPLPTIEWPQLGNHPQYCVTTNKSKHTVISNITVSVKDHSYTTVMCASNNVFGKEEETLKVIRENVTDPENDLIKLLLLISQPQIIIAFLIGVLLTSTTCCLVRSCHRKKPRRSRNMALDNLEMLTTHADSMIDADQALENDHDQDGANVGAVGDVEPEEVEYSDINIALLERSSKRAQGVHDSTESEYAEIKKDKTEERQDNDDQNYEILEGNEKEEAMMGAEEKYCVPEKEEGDDVALYSNLKDVMGEM